MDTRIATAARPDIVAAESTPRPTPTPARVSFSQVLATGVNGLVQGAELVASSLPGSPITATAVRAGGGSAGSSQGVFGASPLAAMLSGAVGGASTATPEGPPATTPAAAGSLGSLTSSTDPNGSIDASLQQSAQMNIFYLQLQEQVDSQNRSYTALSNVLKAEHDTAKSAIGNVHS